LTLVNFALANALAHYRDFAARLSVVPSLSLSKLRLVGWRWVEGGFDRIVDALEPYEPDLVAGFFAHVLEVLAVARRSMTVEIPAWIAASTSSFTAPLGSTRPRSEISPVMAVSLRIVRHPILRD
jgi:hypothetical protein